MHNTIYTNGFGPPVINPTGLAPLRYNTIEKYNRGRVYDTYGNSIPVGVYLVFLLLIFLIIGFIYYKYRNTSKD